MQYRWAFRMTFTQRALFAKLINESQLFKEVTL